MGAKDGGSGGAGPTRGFFARLAGRGGACAGFLLAWVDEGETGAGPVGTTMGPSEADRTGAEPLRNSAAGTGGAAEGARGLGADWRRAAGKGGAGGAFAGAGRSPGAAGSVPGPRVAGADASASVVVEAAAAVRDGAEAGAPAGTRDAPVRAWDRPTPVPAVTDASRVLGEPASVADCPSTKANEGEETSPASNVSERPANGDVAELAVAGLALGVGPGESSVPWERRCAANGVATAPGGSRRAAVGLIPVVGAPGADS